MTALFPGHYSNGRDELIFNATSTLGRGALTVPRLCTIPRLDFRLLFVFQCVQTDGSAWSDACSFGLADYDRIATTGILFDGPHYTPPVELPKRVEHFGLGILERMKRTPDIVGARLTSLTGADARAEFSTLLWDMKHLTEADRVAALPENHLRPEQRQDYHDRLDHALSLLETTFPRAHLSWRSGASLRT